MKVVLILFSLLITAHLIGPDTKHQHLSDTTFIAINGGIRGTIQLANKPSSNRSSGRLYGRPSRNSSQSITADSVLVILSGSSPNQIKEQDVTFLNQLDRKFKPGILPVQIDQTVRITNSDPVYHNVFSLTSPHKFNVGRRPKGEHFDVEFEKPGMVDVFCDIHSNMHAIIYVLPGNAIEWRKIASGESFEFSNLTAGTYTLTYYAMGYTETESSVLVSSDSVSDLGTITINP